MPIEVGLDVFEQVDAELDKMFADESGAYMLVIEVPPVGKPRPRVDSGRGHHTDSYNAWKDEAIKQLKRQWYPLMPVDKVERVHYAVYGVDWRPDSDNVQGSIMDAMVQAEVWSNDNVRVSAKWSGEYEIDRDRPRYEVTFLVAKFCEKKKQKKR